MVATKSVETQNAYHFFVEAIAERTHRPKSDILTETSDTAFLTKVDDLYHQYLAGEFSIGRMAELLGISPFQLDHLLTLLDLPVHN